MRSSVEGKIPEPYLLQYSPEVCCAHPTIRKMCDDLMINVRGKRGGGRRERWGRNNLLTFTLKARLVVLAVLKLEERFHR